jgi:hypothetical protein
LEACNDSALGRALDKIFDAGAKKVLGAAGMGAGLRGDVEFDVVHADTTSWSVKGLFDCSLPDDQSTKISSHTLATIAGPPSSVARKP